MASKLVFLHHHAFGKVLCCKYNLAQELSEHFMDFYSLRNWGQVYYSINITMTS